MEGGVLHELDGALLRGQGAGEQEQATGVEAHVPSE
jgi:hypothetical protein